MCKAELIAFLTLFKKEVTIAESSAKEVGKDLNILSTTPAMFKATETNLVEKEVKYLETVEKIAEKIGERREI